MPAAATTHRAGSQLLVELRGALDLATAPAIRQQLAFVYDELPTCLTLDVRGVTDVDSSGLALILSFHRSQTNRGRRLVVVTGSVQMDRALQMTKLDGVLDVRRDLPASLDGAAPPAESGH